MPRTSSRPSTSAGPSGRDVREWSLRQLIDRVVHKYREAGEENGYFRSADRRRGVRARADLDAAAPGVQLQLAGLVQRRHDLAAAGQRLLHPRRRRHDGLDPELVPRRRPDLQGWFGRRPEPVAHPFVQGAAVLRRHGLGPGVASCAAPTPPPARSSPVAPPAGRPRWSSSTSITPTSSSSSRRRPARKTRSACCATPASTWISAAPTSPASSTRTPTTRSGCPTSSCAPSTDGTEFGLRARETGQVIETVDARELFGKIAQAAWECADPGIQYDDTINDWHTNPESGRITASNPCSEYMSLDNTSCNLASLNLMKFLRDDDTFDAADLRQGRRAHHHRDGHLDLLRGLPDRGDRRQHPRLPAARHRLRQPRRAADGVRPGLRLGRRSRPGRRDHLVDDRRRPTVVRPSWPASSGPTTATPATPLPTRGSCASTPRPTIPPARSARTTARCSRRGRSAVGTGNTIGEQQRLAQRPGLRAGSDRHDRPDDGLRHDRCRARPRAGQVQEAGRRRIDADRQPDGAARAARPGLPGGAGRGDRRVHRRARSRHRRPRPAPGALRGLRLRDGRPGDPADGARADDGGGSAVPVRRDLQDGQPARVGDGRGDRRRLHAGLEARTKGARRLPRQLQGRSAAVGGQGATSRVDRGGAGREGRRVPADPQAAAEGPSVADDLVRRRVAPRVT